jgi:hypothetical protein
LLPPVALASCRQMPPARRRYIVHCIMRYELEPYNRDVRDEKWQAGADRCLWRSAISRSDPIGPLIPTHPCSGRKRLPENKGASSTKATDRENRGLTGRFRFRAIGVFLLVARFARVIALDTPLTRDFGSSPGQPVIGGTISRREPRQPRPFARAPIADGGSAHRNLSRGWNATPAASSLLRKAVARAKLPATHGSQLSIFRGNVPFVPGFSSI